MANNTCNYDIHVIVFHIHVASLTAWLELLVKVALCVIFHEPRHHARLKAQLQEASCVLVLTDKTHVVTKTSGLLVAFGLLV